MKVIFLDIDGVLNWIGTEDRLNGFIGLDPVLIERFNRIIDAHPDVKIVISSTWRKTMHAYPDFPGLVDLLHARGLKGEIIGHTPLHCRYWARGAEIAEWIADWEAKNPNEQLTLVVLDDDTHGMEGHVYQPGYGETVVFGRDLRPFHVVTFMSGDPNMSADSQPVLAPDGSVIYEEGGLQDRHIEAAIKVLNGETL